MIIPPPCRQFAVWSSDPGRRFKVRLGREDGATTITGGGRFGDSGYFVEPTVITNTRPDMKIVRDVRRSSGWGREMGHEALEAYTEVKAVTTQL